MSSDIHTKEPSSPVAASPRRRRWVTLLMMLVMLLSGMVIGAGGAALLIRRQVIAHIHQPEQMPQRATRMLTKRLDLLEKQADAVEQILTYRQQELLQIRRETLPRVNEQLDLVEAEIAAELDDRQRAIFAADFQRLRNTWVPTTD